MMTVNFAKDLLQQSRDVFQSKEKHPRFKMLWHGGEPLLWGVDNFREILLYIKTLFEGCKYDVSIQTNLTLLNDEYINLFKENNVNVGISLDGPKYLHNFLRVPADNKTDSFEIIMSNVKRLQNEGFRIGCVSVLSKKHIGNIRNFYNFMQQNNIFFRANPLYCAGESKGIINEMGITPSEYSEMVIELFDLWYYDETNKNDNSTFIEMASNLITGKTSLCVFKNNCQNGVICISPSGDVVPCGRFCDIELIDKFSYGNLHTDNLQTIINRREEKDAYRRSSYIEKTNCKECYLFSICYGGCLHDGYSIDGNFDKKTIFCISYKKIYKHITNRLREIGIESIIKEPFNDNYEGTNGI